MSADPWRPKSEPDFDSSFKDFQNTVKDSQNTAAAVSIIIAVAYVGGVVAIVFILYKCLVKHGLPSINFNTSGATAAKSQPFATIPYSQIKMTTVENFLIDIAREKPIRFSPQEIEGFTHDYSIKLGSGGFGAVYKGELPNGVPVAVKVLTGSSNETVVEEQFMAEVGTIGRTYHVNLVRLYGFCFDATMRALVYEYMENGSLDNYLFREDPEIEMGTLHEIAIGTAEGIRYLHHECPQRIIHYDIKPANILLDADFSPKIADFGLAKLVSRRNTHVTMPGGGRGTPGYAAPEMWMPSPVTCKCDVYSFGILLFEIVGRRRNFDESRGESQEWFPKWVWEKFENAQLGVVASVCGISEEVREKAERMCKVALWCVQYQPEARPPMSKVVKMLEGEMEIPPPSNPFQHLRTSGTAIAMWSDSSTGSAAAAETSDESSNEYSTPPTTTHVIEMGLINMSSSPSSSPSSSKINFVFKTGIIVGGSVIVVMVIFITRCIIKKSRMRSTNAPTEGTNNHEATTSTPTSSMDSLKLEMEPINRFLDDILKEKPMRFTSQHLKELTHNYAQTLGSGAFGVVYKGRFPNGVQVAVKVLQRTLGNRAEEQFMAEVGTTGRTYHINLVRLYGFCFETTVKALVYEFMENGSLDQCLFDENKGIDWEKKHEIAIGTAKGIRYLHEECEQRIIHYDIKPGNVLLTANFSPKVADFGLAKLCNREKTHVTLAGARGTPGYAAPELWLPLPVTHKCDVYSFGMLLFEILGRRRNLEFQHTESQEWYPRWVWQKFEQGELDVVLSVSGIETKDRAKAERMFKAALWCIQHQPEERPSMGSVVRMLEGEEEIIAPRNPFTHIASYSAGSALHSENTTYLSG